MDMVTNMYRLLGSVIVLLFSMTHANGQEDIRETFDLKVSDFLAVPNFKIDVDSGRQPITKKEDVVWFLDLIKSNYANETKKSSKWIKDNLDIDQGYVKFEKNVGVIFLHHPLELERLKRDNASRRTKIRTEICTLLSAIKSLQKHKESIESDLDLQAGLINQSLLFTLFHEHVEADKKLLTSKPTKSTGSPAKPIRSSGPLIIDATDGEKLESSLNQKLSGEQKDYIISNVNGLNSPTITTREKNELIKSIKKANTPKEITESDAYRNIVNKLTKETLPLVELNLMVYQLLKNLDEQIAEKQAEIEKLREEYRTLFNEFKEGSATSHYLLHGKKGGSDYNDYLLGTREFLVVILGGKGDIANAEIAVKNKKSTFMTSAENLLKLAKDMEILDDKIDEQWLESSTKDIDCENAVENPAESVLQVSLVLISPEKVKPPSEISISHSSFDQISYTIHERVWVNIGIGISAADITRKNFTLDDDNMLTVKTDSIQNSRIRGNALALLEIYPGRDIDRFGTKERPLYERLALVSGVKLSKDPLEAIYLGVGFAIAKGLNITSGISWQSVPKDTPEGGLNVGPNATLNYLQENVGRKYDMEFFLGITMSPSDFSSLIGR